MSDVDPRWLRDWPPDAPEGWAPYPCLETMTAVEIFPAGRRSHPCPTGGHAHHRSARAANACARAAGLPPVVVERLVLRHADLDGVFSRGPARG